jgi:hypothetical protein
LLKGVEFIPKLEVVVELEGTNEGNCDPDCVVFGALDVLVEGANVLGFPNEPVEVGQLGCVVAPGMKLDASGLKIEAGLVSLGGDGAVLSSGKKSPPLESSSIAFDCSPSCCGSASIRPSRIARATPIPLMTATKERLYRFASTMVCEKTCGLGVEDSISCIRYNLWDDVTEGCTRTI